MHTETKRNDPPATASEWKPGASHRLPDPPDPDNLPIDYPGVRLTTEPAPPNTP